MSILPVLTAAAVILISFPATSLAAVKLHALEAYTVEYDISGTRQGTVVEYSRKYGHQQSVVTDTSEAKPPHYGKVRTTVITDGPKMTTIDLQQKSATHNVDEAFYERRVRQMTTKNPAAVQEELLRATGLQPNGATETIAGERCSVWRAQAGSDVLEFCITRDGLLLRTYTKTISFSETKRARKVKRGDGGPEEVYRTPAGMAGK